MVSIASGMIAARVKHGAVAAQVDGLVASDAWLEPHRAVLEKRVAHAAAALEEIERNEGSLLEFAREADDRCRIPSFFFPFLTSLQVRIAATGCSVLRVAYSFANGRQRSWQCRSSASSVRLFETIGFFFPLWLTHTALKTDGTSTQTSVSATRLARGCVSSPTTPAPASRRLRTTRASRSQ